MTHCRSKLQPENLIGIKDLGLDGWEDGNDLPFEDRHTDDTVLDFLGLCLMHCYLHCLGEVRTARGGLVFAIHHEFLNLEIVFDVTHSMRWSVTTSSPKCHRGSTETNRCKFRVELILSTDAVQ